MYFWHTVCQFSFSNVSLLTFTWKAFVYDTSRYGEVTGSEDQGYEDFYVENRHEMLECNYSALIGSLTVAKANQQRLCRFVRVIQFDRSCPRGRIEFYDDEPARCCWLFLKTFLSRVPRNVFNDASLFVDLNEKGTNEILKEILHRRWSMLRANWFSSGNKKLLWSHSFFLYLRVIFSKSISIQYNSNSLFMHIICISKDDEQSHWHRVSFKSSQERKIFERRDIIRASNSQFTLSRNRIYRNIEH